MPATLKCPACDKWIAVEVPPGTQVRCPLCNRIVTVPDTIGPPGPAPPMPRVVQTAPAARQGLAVAALVCGCVGLAGCLPVGLVGVVLGIVALVKINHDAARYRGRGLAIAGICVGGASILTTLLWVAVLLPSLSRARELSKRTACAAHLRAIGQALYLYAQTEPEGAFPDDVNKLLATGYITARQFTCPADRPGAVSYYYVPGYGTASDPNQIILYEHPSIHGGEGGNILYQDGHVSFVRQPQFDRDIGALTLPDGTPYAPHEE